jgi:hypothetical protein
MTPAQFWQIEMNNRQDRADRAAQQQQTLSNALANLGDAYSKSQQDQGKMQTSLTALNAMGNFAEQFGDQGVAFKNALGKELAALGKNPDRDKLAGVTMAFVPHYEALISNARTQSQYDAALDLARQKQALGLGGGTSGTAASNAITYQF